jgi:hypothetical protein
MTQEDRADSAELLADLTLRRQPAGARAPLARSDGFGPD